jgi:hypothetical protein
MAEGIAGRFVALWESLRGGDDQVRQEAGAELCSLLDDPGNIAGLIGLVAGPPEPRARNAAYATVFLFRIVKIHALSLGAAARCEVFDAVLPLISPATPVSVDDFRILCDTITWIGALCDRSPLPLLAAAEAFAGASNLVPVAAHLLSLVVPECEQDAVGGFAELREAVIAASGGIFGHLAACLASDDGECRRAGLHLLEAIFVLEDDDLPFDPNATPAIVAALGQLFESFYGEAASRKEVNLFCKAVEQGLRQRPGFVVENLGWLPEAIIAGLSSDTDVDIRVRTVDFIGAFADNVPDIFHEHVEDIVQPVVVFSKGIVGASDEVDAAGRLFAGLAGSMAEDSTPIETFTAFSVFIDALFGEDSPPSWVVALVMVDSVLPALKDCFGVNLHDVLGHCVSSGDALVVTWACEAIKTAAHEWNGTQCLQLLHALERQLLDQINSHDILDALYALYSKAPSTDPTEAADRLIGACQDSQPAHVEHLLMTVGSLLNGAKVGEELAATLLGFVQDVLSQEASRGAICCLGCLIYQFPALVRPFACDFAQSLIRELQSGDVDVDLWEKSVVQFTNMVWIYRSLLEETARAIDDAVRHCISRLSEQTVDDEDEENRRHWTPAHCLECRAAIFACYPGLLSHEDAHALAFAVESRLGNPEEAAVSAIISRAMIDVVLGFARNGLDAAKLGAFQALIEASAINKKDDGWHAVASVLAQGGREVFAPVADFLLKAVLGTFQHPDYHDRSGAFRDKYVGSLMDVLIQAFAVAQGVMIDANTADQILDQLSELHQRLKAPASRGHICWAMAAGRRWLPELADRRFEQILNGLEAQLDPAAPEGFRAALEGITWMVELGPDRISEERYREYVKVFDHFWPGRAEFEIDVQEAALMLFCTIVVAGHADLADSTIAEIIPAVVASSSTFSVVFASRFILAARERWPAFAELAATCAINLFKSVESVYRIMNEEDLRALAEQIRNFDCEQLTAAHIHEDELRLIRIRLAELG